MLVKSDTQELDWGGGFNTNTVQNNLKIRRVLLAKRLEDDAGFWLC